MSTAPLTIVRYIPNTYASQLLGISSCFRKWHGRVHILNMTVFHPSLIWRGPFLPSWSWPSNSESAVCWHSGSGDQGQNNHHSHNSLNHKTTHTHTHLRNHIRAFSSTWPPLEIPLPWSCTWDRRGLENRRKLGGHSLAWWWRSHDLGNGLTFDVCSRPSRFLSRHFFCLWFSFVCVEFCN